MRLPLALTAALIFSHSSTQTDSRPSSPYSVAKSSLLARGVRVKLHDTEDHLNKPQNVSNNEPKDVNNQSPIIRPMSRKPGNVQREIEARAAFPIPLLPPRASYSDGFYQPFTCSSRFGTHITVSRCLRLIYDRRLDGVDELHFRDVEDQRPGVFLPLSLTEFVVADMPHIIIDRQGTSPQYPIVDRGHNIQILLFRMMLHCVANGGGVGGQGSLLSGLSVTLYGADTSDADESEPGDEESEAGNPADLFSEFVPGARAHTGSTQRITPLQGGY
ncbi:hypothetical protein MMC26_007159 [Xylographa opegraphella]|nr:hypothetical protein [Xylographa opegraphella]